MLRCGRVEGVWLQSGRSELRFSQSGACGVGSYGEEAHHLRYLAGAQQTAPPEELVYFSPSLPQEPTGAGLHPQCSMTPLFSRTPVMTSTLLSQQPLPGLHPTNLSAASDTVEPSVLFLPLALKTTHSPGFPSPCWL